MREVLNLCKNAWEWNLPAFARHTGLDPDSFHTRELFQDFQTAARLLSGFDGAVLAALCRREGRRRAEGDDLLVACRFALADLKALPGDPWERPPGGLRGRKESLVRVLERAIEQAEGRSPGA